MLSTSARTDADAAELTTTHAIIPSGVYTVVGASGWRTFTIERQSDGDDFAAGQRIISLLTGHDNESPDSWKRFGFVRDEAHRWPISVWLKNRNAPSGPPSDFEVYAHLLTDMICNGMRRFNGLGGTPYTYKILLSRRCFRCDRRLTTPESLAAGIGPDCARKTRGGQ